LALFAWAILHRLGHWPEYVLPGPEAVGRRLLEGAASRALWWAVAISIRRLLCGYAVAAALGLVFGLVLGRTRWLADAVGPVVIGLQALPSVCWLPLAILWFGLSEGAILFVVVMGSLLAITIGTEGAVRTVPPLYVRAGRTLGGRGVRLYTRVLLPAAMPGVVTSLKLGWSFAWRSLMAGELLYQSGGLGQQLQLGRELNDMAQVMAIMTVIVVVGLAVERALFSRAEARLHERWGLRVER
jgi:NitT/TauT family transport system permease protein